MLHRQFKFTAQALPYTLLAILLIYILFDVIQPVSSAWGASVLQSITGTTAVPPYLNYQGVLRDVEGKPMSGLHSMTFRIYDRVSAPLNEARSSFLRRAAIYGDLHQQPIPGNGRTDKGRTPGG